MIIVYIAGKKLYLLLYNVTYYYITTTQANSLAIFNGSRKIEKNVQKSLLWFIKLYQLEKHAFFTSFSYTDKKLTVEMAVKLQLLILFTIEP